VARAEQRAADAPVTEPDAQQVEESAVDAPTSPSTLTVRWARDAVAHPPPEPEEVIEGMLRLGELCVIGGPRAIGKSWAASNAGVLAARGTGYLFGQLRIVRAARVLIAQGEVDEWESFRRWAMLTGDEGPPDGVAETFDRWRIRTTRHRSSSSFGSKADGVQSHQSREWIDAVLDGRLEATIVEHGFEILVIDPWAVYFAGAENSNDEVEAALDKLRDLAMRYRLAIVIFHHIGKSTDVREPEDLWRGASRLADWASTRVTLLPHYTDKQAADQGMTREQARRYVDVRFLRRSVPTPDFSMVLDPATGWWSRWVAPQEAADSRRIHLDVPDIVDGLRKAGGAWSSQRKAADDLGLAQETARKLLASAMRAGAIEAVKGERGATIYRLPAAHLGDDLGDGR
jgi:hypothetical protein